MKCKEIISEEVNFPKECETEQNTTCLIPMLMGTDQIPYSNNYDYRVHFAAHIHKQCGFFYDGQKGNCKRCGQCKD